MINVADTLKPKNNGKFPVAEAVDIQMADGSRVEEKITTLSETVTVVKDDTVEIPEGAVLVINENGSQETNSIDEAVERYLNRVAGSYTIDLGTLTSSKYIIYTTGAIGNFNESLSTTDFIEVIPGALISFKYGFIHTPDLRGLAFYDQDKLFVGGYQYHTIETSDKISYVPVPAGARYARFTVFSDTVNNKMTFYLNTIASIIEMNERLKVFEGLVKDNPLKSIIKDGGFCRIFRKWGFIGDSLSSGEHEYKKADGTTGFIDLYEHSFGQQVGRICNATAINFSCGGATTKTILNNYQTELFETEENICDVYVIYLGTNDFGSNSTIEAGTIDDVDTTDYNNNAETFYGMYAKIVQKILEVQPKAKIFTMTLPKYAANDNGKAVCNKAIKDVAGLFGCYVLDINTYGEVQNSAWMAKYATGWHLNSMGYLKYAWMITTYIDWIIRNNPTDFKEVAFIGTDYTYYG